MAATKQTLDALINESTGLYKDNTAGDISASDGRNMIASTYGLYTEAISTADANPTVAVATLNVLDISGFSADRTFTLPVAANVVTGDRCGVMLSTGDDSFELLLKSGAAGDLINGVDHSSTAWSKLFITGEVVIFLCINGTTGDWIVEYDGRIPCKCSLYLSSQQTGFAYNAWDAVELNTAADEVGDIADEASNRLVFRRAGKIIAYGIARADETLVDQQLVGTALVDDASGTTTYAIAYMRGSGTSQFITPNPSLYMAVADGGTLMMRARYVYSSGTVGTVAAGQSNTYLYAVEGF